MFYRPHRSARYIFLPPELQQVFGSIARQPIQFSQCPFYRPSSFSITILFRKASDTIVYQRLVLSLYALSVHFLYLFLTVFFLGLF